jgi:hypothetical protein
LLFLLFVEIFIIPASFLSSPFWSIICINPHTTHLTLLRLPTLDRGL